MVGVGSDTRIDAGQIIEKGLPKTERPKKVIIVGGGMAGLVAGYELRRAGHDPLILEARGRAGGRIETIREPFAPGLYAEAGAMRLPKSHKLTMAYVDKFGLKTMPFTMGHPNGYYSLMGTLVRIGDVDNDPDCLGFNLAPHERGQTISRLWEQTIRPFIDGVAARGDEAWAEITAENDHYSTHEFLKEKGWSEEAVELFGLLLNQEALLNASFLEVLREEINGCYVDLLQIEGGMDRLPNSFLPELGPSIRFGAQMIAIGQDPDGVTVHYKTGADRFSVRGDTAILTVPFPVMRHVEVLTPFSREKQRAIRQLYYDASAKIFFQVGRRFWEQDDGIYGGGSITDMAVRNIYYPEHGRETGRGVLLASYTWSEDAQRWGSLPLHQQIEQALENVSVIHPAVRECFEVGISKMWHDDTFAGGAFALFQPDQQTRLHGHITKPEGRIHFAGEHTSLHHAWIQGAIESGLRAAHEVHSAA